MQDEETDTTNDESASNEACCAKHDPHHECYFDACCTNCPGIG